MLLLHVIVILVVIGFILYLINHYAPIDSKVKQILNWVVVIALLIWLVGLFFPEACNSFHDIRIGR